MWKKFLAASAVAVGMAGVLACGDALGYAVISPYTSGNDIPAQPGDVKVCVEKEGGYSGDPIFAVIRGENYEKQAIIGGFEGDRSCVMMNGVPHDAELKFITPMEMTNLSYNEMSLAGESTYVLLLNFMRMTEQYLRLSGGVNQTVVATHINISFDANGGEGAMAGTSSLEPGASYTLPQNAFTRSNYRFMGWNTKADGTGTHYDNIDTVVVDSSMAGELVLYAQWLIDEAVLDRGWTVNLKLKQQVDPTVQDESNSDLSIKAFRRANDLPTGFDTSNSANIISSDSSVNDIYVWFDDADIDDDGAGDGVMYYYSEASTIRGGEYMGGIFYRMKALVDISGVADWDTSDAVSLSNLFDDDEALEDISPIATWNTSKVITLSNLLLGSNVSSVDPLETKRHPGKDYVSWDVSKVNSMDCIFQDTPLTDISALASWDTSSVENLRDAFFDDVLLEDISALASWDTSSVEDMQGTFAYTKKISDFSPLSTWNTSSVTILDHMFISSTLTNTDPFETKQHSGKDYVSWDVSNVKSMVKVFSGNNNLEDISALYSWNTSKVERMSYFVAGSRITNVDALETKRYAGRDYISWDVSNVEDMSSMFRECSLLSDLSKLATWDISGATDMSYMFYRDYAVSSLSPLFDWAVDSTVTVITEMFGSVPSAVARPDWYNI